LVVQVVYAPIEGRGPRPRGWFERRAAALLAAIAPLVFVGAARAAAPSADLDTIVVVANAPLPGFGVAADKLPGEVQALSAPDLLRGRRGDALPNALAAQLSSVSLENQQGSPFQPDFVYRGFEASPVSGVAQGVAVYQDGVRVNEAFGDNVNWDLVPEFAVQQITVQSDNPVFGLNDIGGMVGLQMKSGLAYRGLGARLSGGAFGDIATQAEYGSRSGPVGIYLGAGVQHEDGFRYASPATLRKAYGDLAYQAGPLELHLSLSGALNDVHATGPTPVELLARDPKAVFTVPQSMRNAMALAQLRGVYQASPILALSFNAYYRRFHQRLVDGNTTDVAVCVNDPAQLCLEGAGVYPGDALYSAEGQSAPAAALPPGATPGQMDRTRTATDSFGGALQASLKAPLAGHANSFTAGVSVDRGQTGYRARAELASITDALAVVGSGVVIDQASSPTAQPPILAPVDVAARNTYAGAYAINVLDLTRRLSVTLSARLNYAEIGLVDRLGSSLSGRHSFIRINPGAGFTYKLNTEVTAYAGYSQSSRAPTAGELSCADPANPCLLDAFLVSDPPLKQVVSRDVEFGLRGRFAAPFLTGTASWSVGAYRIDSDRDILLLATSINGFGYFQNAGVTRRQGIDARLDYRGRRWRGSLSYSHLNATFQTPETLSSNSPAANASGLIQIEPGDHLPMSPAHRLTVSADVDVTSALTLGADLRLQSGQFLVGDASNQEPRLAGFATLELRADYQLKTWLALFADIENLTDRRYYTYGAFTDVGRAPSSAMLTDPRTYTPAPGRAVFVGLRARFE
jgi:iron complex outermembrane receptor protein